MSPQSNLPSLVVLAALLFAGCATDGSSNATSSNRPQAEMIQPTGSRISRSVPRNKPAGVASDMPGVTAGAGMIEAKQNSNAQSDKSNAGGN